MYAIMAISLLELLIFKMLAHYHTLWSSSDTTDHVPFVPFTFERARMAYDHTKYD